MKNSAFISITILFFLVLYLGHNNLKLRLEKKALKETLKEKDKLLGKTAEKALKWELYAFKLDEITDKYQSSRKAKRENKELLELGTSLNFDYE